MYIPPLTGIVAPVTYAAPSDARKETHIRNLLSLAQTAQRKSASARLHAVLPAVSRGHIGVDEPRGHRVDRKSTASRLPRASARLKPSRPAFRRGIVLLGLRCPWQPTTEPILIIRPPNAPWSCRAKTPLDRRNRLFKLVSTDVMPLVVFHPHHQIIAGDTGIIHQNRRRAELCGDLGPVRQPRTHRWSHSAQGRCPARRFPSRSRRYARRPRRKWRWPITTAP